MTRFERNVQPQVPRADRADPDALYQAVLRAAREVVDQVMVQTLRGWNRVHVQLERSPSGIRVQTKDIQIGPSDGPEPELHEDPFWRTAMLTVAVRQLQKALNADNVEWDGTAIEVVRRNRELFSVTALGLGDTEIASVQVSHADLRFGERFLGDVATLVPKLEARNAMVRSTVGGYLTWTWDRESGELTFAFADRPTLRQKAHLLGSYSKTQESWCWAWANSSIEPHLAREVSALASSAGPGERLFADGGFACEEGFAWMVASLAAEKLGGLPAFTVMLPQQRIRLFFAIGDKPSVGFT
jgi:hypothetical protein